MLLISMKVDALQADLKTEQHITFKHCGSRALFLE